MKPGIRGLLPVLFFFCLPEFALSVGFSKPEARETQIRARRDSVYVRNLGSQALRIRAVKVGLESSRYPSWELSFRTLGAVEICFGRGGGACPPAGPGGRIPVTWTIPARDSLLLFDFNLASCIRCPLNAAVRGAAEDSLMVPLTLVGEDEAERDTLWLEARLARTPVGGIPAPIPGPSGKKPGGG